MLRSMVVFLCLCSTGLCGEVIIRNKGSNTIEVRSKSETKRIGIGKTGNLNVDNLFKTDIKVYYQGKMVAATQVKPSNSVSKLEVYKEKGMWLIRPAKY